MPDPYSLLYGWGHNYDGQLGDGTNEMKNMPTPIGLDNDWLWVESFSGSTFALKTDGTLYAWGDNLFGRLGDGTYIDRITPAPIGQDNDWTRIIEGSWHTLSIKADGTLYAWGSNFYGQLGDGTKEDRNTPTQIGSDNDWDQVATGMNHSLALKTDGSLYAWGSNWCGQLGDGTNIIWDMQIIHLPHLSSSHFPPSPISYPCIIWYYLEHANYSSLLELIWPEEDVCKTVKRLHVALPALRKILEPNALKGSSSYLVRDNDLYRLDFKTRGWVDVDLFLHEVKQADAKKHLPDKLPNLLKAETLYTGEFLEEDPYTDWCMEERDRLKTAYLNKGVYF